MTKFANESEFEKHLRKIIKSRITSKNPNVYALRHKTVGDIVIVRDGASPAMFFLGNYSPKLSTARPASAI